MSPQFKSALGTYARSLLACFITAIVAVSGDTPIFSLTHNDWLRIANSVWVSAVPVLLRALNPNDTQYGVGA